MRALTVRRGAVLAAFVTFGALLSAPPAYAGTPGGGGHRAPALCGRLPQLEARIDRALARLDGDASVKGSIARIRERATVAEGNGHPQVAAYLEGVLATRRHLAPELRQRKADLALVKAWCAARPVGTTT